MKFSSLKFIIVESCSVEIAAKIFLSDRSLKTIQRNVMFFSHKCFHFSFIIFFAIKALEDSKHLRLLKVNKSICGELLILRKANDKIE